MAYSRYATHYRADGTPVLLSCGTELTEADVAMIRAEFCDRRHLKLNANGLALRWRVAVNLVNAIVYGDLWSHIEPAELAR